MDQNPESTVAGILDDAAAAIFTIIAESEYCAKG
jgi:hypothetical protein